MKTIAKNIKLLSQVTDIFNEFDWPNLLFEGIWLAEPSIVRQKKKSQRSKFFITTLLTDFLIYWRLSDKINKKCDYPMGSSIIVVKTKAIK